MSDPATVSIILPTYNGGAYLNETLSAIRAQAYPAPVEILAIDSQSRDNTVDLLHQYGATVHSIPQKSFGHGRTRNQGARLATGDILVFLSQDALPVGTDWLGKLVGSVQAPAIGAVYTRQLPRPKATPFEAYFHLELYPPHSTIYEPTLGKSISLDRIFFSNVCSAARREVCLRFPFDETLIMSEDQAFAKSLLMAGYRTLYNADVAVVHSHHYDLKTLFRRNFDSAYSLRSVSGDSFGYQARRAFRYMAGEAAYVIRNGTPQWLLFLPIYEGVRTAGRLFGKYADHLPKRMKLQMSLHRGYWTKESMN